MFPSCLQESFTPDIRQGNAAYISLSREREEKPNVIFQMTGNTPDIRKDYMTQKKEAKELLSLAGIARETGRTRQTVLEQRGKLPPADFYFSAGIRKTELWKRSTLVRAGILDEIEKMES